VPLKPKPSLPLSPAKGSVGATTTIGQNLPAQSVKGKTFFEKVKDFFAPIVPSFLKPSVTPKPNEMPNLPTSSPTSSAATLIPAATSQRSSIFWFLIPIILVLIWLFYKKYKNKK
jgi:hypothetical protein